MDFLKDVFNGEALDWDAFTKAITDKGIKLADLAGGDYVSKHKYEDDVKSRDTQIKKLSEQIESRNTDLQTLQEKMKEAQNDTAKLDDVTKQLQEFQANYGKMEETYKTQLAKQQYEFAVKEFANEQKFTSAAAKRDFIRNLIDKSLQMEDNKIIGASDYLATYKAENTDAIASEEPIKPQFVDTTKAQKAEPKPNPFLKAMNFTTIRPEPKKE